MAAVELIMPKMGESIIEATILSWNKQVGDSVEADDTILEIATDKVDSEVPAPVAGVLTEVRFAVDDVVPVGEVIAVIDTAGDGGAASEPAGRTNASPAANGEAANGETAEFEQDAETPRVEVLQSLTAPLLAPSATGSAAEDPVRRIGGDGRFYSPLVRRIAEQEGISQSELDALPGSGHDGRVNKQDVLNYLTVRQSGGAASARPAARGAAAAPSAPAPSNAPVAPGDAGRSVGADVEVVEMDRMRRMIADHMVSSVQTSPHVTSFVEADVTNMARWRERNKAAFAARYGEKITFTPIFMEAVVKAISDFPQINASVDGNRILVKRRVNVGMAAALPSGNLIVPVVHDANLLSLVGLAKAVNDLAGRARQNKLKPDEVQGGTFTLTNVGTFGNVMGTPIINQPQVAILATGAIRKRPAVLETPDGDVIAIRQMMFLSLSYDHRVVDGFLGGSFLRRVGDYLEAFDPNRSV